MEWPRHQLLFEFIFIIEVSCFLKISVAFVLTCHYADSSFCIVFFLHFFSLGHMNINFRSTKDYCIQITLFYLFFFPFPSSPSCWFYCQNSYLEEKETSKQTKKAGISDNSTILLQKHHWCGKQWTDQWVNRD